jgi:hypothetical protein
MARYLMGALRTLALADADISALVDTRIYVNRIPEAIIEDDDTDTFHPPKMLVIRQQGGFGKRDILGVDHETITALCYGETDYEAERVRLAVFQRFTTLSRETHDGVLIHHVNKTSGPIPLLEPEIVWPAVAQSFSVYADTLEVA